MGKALGQVPPEGETDTTLYTSYSYRSSPDGQYSVVVGKALGQVPPEGDLDTSLYTSYSLLAP